MEDDSATQQQMNPLFVVLWLLGIVIVEAQSTPIRGQGPATVTQAGIGRAFDQPSRAAVCDNAFANATLATSADFTAVMRARFVVPAFAAQNNWLWSGFRFRFALRVGGGNATQSAEPLAFQLDSVKYDSRVNGRTVATTLRDGVFGVLPAGGPQTLESETQTLQLRGLLEDVTLQFRFDRVPNGVRSFSPRIRLLETRVYFFSPSHLTLGIGRGANNCGRLCDDGLGFGANPSTHGTVDDKH